LSSAFTGKTGNDLIHRVVHELAPKFREGVGLAVLERRFERTGGRAPSRASSLPEEFTCIIGFLLLSNDAASAQVADQQAIEISFSRILSRGIAVQVGPNAISRDPRCPEDLPDHCKVRLMVHVDPTDEESQNVVRTESRPSCVGEEIRDELAFLVRFGAVPGAKTLPNERQVRRVLNAFINRWPDGREAGGDFREGVLQEAQFPLVLFKPPGAQVVGAVSLAQK